MEVLDCTTNTLKMLKFFQLDLLAQLYRHLCDSLVCCYFILESNLLLPRSLFPILLAYQTFVVLQH